MPKGWGSPIGTGQLVKIYMLARAQEFNKGVSAYRTYKFIRDYMDEELRGKYQPPSYQSVAEMFYILKKLGMIVGPLQVPPSDERPGRTDKHVPPANFANARKRFYTIAKDKVEAPEWKNPYLAFRALRKPDQYRATWQRVQTMEQPKVLDEAQVLAYAAAYVREYDVPPAVFIVR